MHRLIATLTVIGAVIPAVAFATVEGGAEAPTTTTKTTATVAKKPSCGKECRARVAAKKKAKIRAACKSKSCKRRVALKQRNKRWREYTAPYQDWLLRVRTCESGSDGLYKANTGNGFYGAYQFDYGTWISVGGSGTANQASPLEQDYRAVKLLKSRGTSPWPVCG